MSAQMSRLFEIILMLPRYPRFLTTEKIQGALLQQGIKNHIRTIERDMLVLEKAFRPRISCERCNDKTIRWFWTKDAQVINPKVLTTNQALSFGLLKKYLAPLFPKVTLSELEPFFEEAETTLKNEYDNPLLEWPKKIAIVQPSQPLLMPQVNSEIQSIVSGALFTDRLLHIDYKRSDGVENSYRVNPLGLVLRNGSMYLIATKADSGDRRIFALHRIQLAEQINTPTERPAGFDLQQFIDDGHMGFDLTGGGSYKPIKLKAIFDPITANHLSESRLSEDQSIEKLDDQHFMISATVQETEQLFWWLLSFGFRVEVLEPDHLRQKMADSVRELAKKYQID
jgi:predicted DNA-binding transcriptional regulator YafY